MSELSVGALSGLAANSYVIDVASGSQLTQPGMVLQVVSTAKTDTFSTTSTSFTPVTGLTATITPSSASNKILIIVEMSFGQSSTTAFRQMRITGGNSGDYIGDASGSRTRSAFGTRGLHDVASQEQVTLSYLDSPSTTSSVTYGIDVLTSTGTLYLNRTSEDTDSATFSRTASSITVMEIAG